MINKLKTLHGALKQAAEQELDELEIPARKLSTSTKISEDGHTVITLEIELIGRTDALILLDEFLSSDFATQRAALEVLNKNANDT